MEKEELIEKIVDNYAEKAHVTNIEEIKTLKNRLKGLTPEEAVDQILISLNRFHEQNRMTTEDVMSGVDLILQLGSEKYTTPDDLANRLNWIRSMNLTYTPIPLSENHRLVMEVFDKFNGLCGLSLDSFYTGGLMGYIKTGHKLERYHGDLDLFINEDQLSDLVSLVETSEDFAIISKLDTKNNSGHEFEITYRNEPMTIGLFLFEREGENIVTNTYYKKDGELVVDKRFIPAEAAILEYPRKIEEHNGTFYRMQSLESVFIAKENGRPKDRYDADIIRGYLNPNKVESLKEAKKGEKSFVGSKPTSTTVEDIHDYIRSMRERKENKGTRY